LRHPLPSTLYPKPCSSGIATLELLIAFALAVTLLVGATLVSFGGQSASLDVALGGQGMATTTNFQQASVLGAFTDWAGTIAGTPTIYKAGGDIYDVGSTTVDVSECMKGIGINTNWKSEKNRGQYLGLATLVASTSAAKKLGGDCSPIPPGDWSHPDSYNISDPIPSGNQGTDLDTVGTSGKMYVLLTTNKNGGSDTLFVVDVTNPQAPLLKGSYSKDDKDLFAVDAISTGFVFAVGASTTAQLQIVDISNPSNPILSAKAVLPDITNGIGRSVYYYDNKVYVGTQYVPCVGPGCTIFKNNEFHIFDVSNPSTPVWIDSIDVDRNVNSIVVRDGLAYLATGAGSAPYTQLKVYDVDPFHVLPNPITTYKQQISSLSVSGSEAGTSVYSIGNRLYFGRGCVPSTRNDFYILDITPPLPSDLSTARILGSAFLDLKPCGGPNSVDVVDIAAQGNLVFIGSGDTNPNNGGGPFLVYDVSTPSSPQPVIACSFNYSEKTTGLDYSEGLIFVSSESNDALRIIYPALTCSP